MNLYCIKCLMFTEGNNIQIKRHSQVTRLGCILDETMPGESVTHKVISRVYARL